MGQVIDTFMEQCALGSQGLKKRVSELRDQRAVLKDRITHFDKEARQLRDKLALGGNLDTMLKLEDDKTRAERQLAVVDDLLPVVNWHMESRSRLRGLARKIELSREQFDRQLMRFKGPHDPYQDKTRIANMHKTISQLTDLQVELLSTMERLELPTDVMEPLLEDHVGYCLEQVSALQARPLVKPQGGEAA